MSQAGAIVERGTAAGFLVSLTGNSGGTVFGDGAGNINIIGTGAVSVTDNPGTHTMTISVSDTGLTWNVVTSGTNPNSLVASNGYIPKGAGVVQFLLPAAAVIGDTFKIAGYGNLWTLGQNALQSVTLGSQTTSVGVLGSITATQVRDSIELICVTANTEFQILNSVGNLTFA
jgi:hypothetical protein